MIRTRTWLAMASALLLPLILLSLAYTVLAVPTAAMMDEELIRNGDFAAGDSEWWTTVSVDGTVTDGVYNLSITAGGTNPWDAIVGQSAIALQAGETYTLTLTISGTAAETVSLLVQKDSDPYTGYLSEAVTLSPTPETLQFVFTQPVDDAAAALQIQMGGNGEFDITLADVSLMGPVQTEFEYPEGELVADGGFDDGQGAWFNTGTVDADASTGALCGTLLDPGTETFDAILGLNALAIEGGRTYTATITASADMAVDIPLILTEQGGDFTEHLSEMMSLTTTPQTFQYVFSPADSDPAASLQVRLGALAVLPTVCIDDVSLTSAVESEPEPAVSTYERIVNGDFENGSVDPWWQAGAVERQIIDGAMCVSVPADPTSNPWDYLTGEDGTLLEIGEMYNISFDAYATVPVTINVNVGASIPNYTGTYQAPAAVTTATQTFTYTFVSTLEGNLINLSWHLGAQTEDYQICFDNISLQGGTINPLHEHNTGPTIRVNQVGYAPGFPMKATIVNDATEPLMWSLKDSDGMVVMTGDTTVFGYDGASDNTVHKADFSGYAGTGTDFTLEVDGEDSYPFDIEATIYDQMKTDALHYFYHNRSGITITQPYVAAEYTRPAGHIGIAPNTGDTAVTCDTDLPASLDPSLAGCDYSLDVTQGWYDAGDYGKYVVNGGISVWTLLNSYERTLHVAGANGGAFADGSMPIPENNNGTPDILDEVRWELEFLLKMQVPAGEAMAGMAHHKIHDQTWDSLGIMPSESDKERVLQPPSTAATLNLAATAAMCARLYEAYDTDFAGQCLNAAEVAWEAAVATPDLYAPADNNSGGGPYDDSDVSDEFYWAAAELYIATGKQVYLDYLTMTGLGGYETGGFSWGSVGMLGNISLATVPNGLATADMTAVADAITTHADEVVGFIDSQGYGVAYLPDNYDYVWGSNSSVLNNLIIVGTAFDVSGDTTYENAVMEGMDYILGRNAINQSYVSGYGDFAPQNLYHTFWAPQIDSSLPEAPAGALAGGPNTGLQDPMAAVALEGCIGQNCYLDDQSFSTNEVAVNWNSALTWVSAYAAETANVSPTAVTMNNSEMAQGSMQWMLIVSVLILGTAVTLTLKRQR